MATAAATVAGRRARPTDADREPRAARRTAAPDQRQARPAQRTARAAARSANPAQRTARAAARSANPAPRPANPAPRRARPAAQPVGRPSRHAAAAAEALSANLASLTPPARPQPRPRSRTQRAPHLALQAPRLDRIVRGRAWIPVLGAMLLAIVGLRVEVLKLGAGVGTEIQRITTLQSSNAALRAGIAELSDNQRITRLAESYGMQMPNALDVHFVQASAGHRVAAAIHNISAPASGSFLAGLANERQVDQARTAAGSTLSAIGGPPQTTTSATTTTVGGTAVTGGGATGVQAWSAVNTTGGAAPTGTVATPTSTTGSTVTPANTGGAVVAGTQSTAPVGSGVGTSSGTPSVTGSANGGASLNG